MMTVLRFAIPAVAGLLIGWSGSHLFRERASIPAAPPSASVEVVPAATGDGTPSIATLPTAQRIEPSQLAESRDIFRYRDSEPLHRERVAPIEIVALPAIAPAAVSLPVEQRQEPPQLGYTFIGTFGPDGAPIAAFSHNGEVVIAQPGQRIDEHYKLRSVRLESVDVERADGGAMRVTVGSSRP